MEGHSKNIRHIRKMYAQTKALDLKTSLAKNKFFIELIHTIY